MSDSNLSIRQATEADVPLILSLIQDLAEYERLRHECVADEAALHIWLFGEERLAEVIIGEWDGAPVGFALFFRNFSTFLGRPGIYLEDLYVRQKFRGHGIGEALLRRLAHLALERNCGRLEWSVLDWNKTSRSIAEFSGAYSSSDTT